MAKLTRPLTVVLRRDRHPVIDPGMVVAGLGFDPDSFQILPILHAPNGWQAWRIYANVAPVDTAQALDGAELDALDRQPGICGVWVAR